MFHVRFISVLNIVIVPVRAHTRNTQKLLNCIREVALRRVNMSCKTNHLLTSNTSMTRSKYNYHKYNAHIYLHRLSLRFLPVVELSFSSCEKCQVER